MSVLESHTLRIEGVVSRSQTLAGREFGYARLVRVCQDCETG